MADEKGSDLDVFEGLSKKQGRPSFAPPPPSNAPRAKTLIGVSAVPLPPPPGSSSGALTKQASVPPLPAPSSTSGTDGALAAVPPPPSTQMGVAPPADKSSKEASTALSAASVPSSPNGVTASSLNGRSATPGGTNHDDAPAAGEGPTDKPASSAPALPAAQPTKKAPVSTASVDMDWDDDEESTAVYDKDKSGDVKPSGPRPAAGTPAVPRVQVTAALAAGSGGLARASVPPASLPPASLPPTSLPPASLPPASLPPAGPTLAMPSVPPMGPVPGLGSAPPPAGFHQNNIASMPSAPPTHAMPFRSDDPTMVNPRASASGGRAGLIVGVLALVVAVFVLVLVLRPTKGELKIDIKSEGGDSISKVEVFINGTKRCDTTPCIVRDLDKGDAIIKVLAPGFSAPEPMTESVEAGKEKVVAITLSKDASERSTDTTVASIGLRIGGSQENVKVSIDGSEKGTLPLFLKDIEPGTHKLRFDGGERFEPLEQTVEVSKDKVTDLGAVKLNVVKGQIVLEVETQGATVELVSQGAKHIEKKVPESLLRSSPVRIEVDGSEPWSVSASKKGFDAFSQTVSFDDGKAIKTVRIELSQAGSAEAPKVAQETRTVSAHSAPKAPRTQADEKKSAEASTSATPSGGGTLNMNSIPVSKVVLDGRPLGSTPKLAVPVPAGSHTVTFIHPELGKKSVSIQVKAGETKTAAVKF